MRIRVITVPRAMTTWNHLGVALPFQPPRLPLKSPPARRRVAGAVRVKPNPRHFDTSNPERDASIPPRGAVGTTFVVGLTS